MTKFYVNCGDLNTTITSSSSGEAAREVLRHWYDYGITEFAAIVVVSENEIKQASSPTELNFSTLSLLKDMGILCECGDGCCRKARQVFQPRLCRDTIS